MQYGRQILPSGEDAETPSQGLLSHEQGVCWVASRSPLFFQNWPSFPSAGPASSPAFAAAVDPEPRTAPAIRYLQIIPLVQIHGSLQLDLYAGVRYIICQHQIGAACRLEESSKVQPGVRNDHSMSQTRGYYSPEQAAGLVHLEAQPALTRLAVPQCQQAECNIETEPPALPTQCNRGSGPVVGLSHNAQ